jgi:hypothetical protein
VNLFKEESFTKEMEILNEGKERPDFENRSRRPGRNQDLSLGCLKNSGKDLHFCYLSFVQNVSSSVGFLW